LKEGYCIIDDATYLIECKKRYGLEAQQLKIRQFISAEIFRISKKIRVGFEFICIIKLKSKTLTRQQLSESLKEFKNYILNTGQKDSVVILDYEFMNFEIFPFEEELSKKLTDKTIETDIFFICKNSYEFIEDYLPKFIPGSGGTIYENPKFRFHITIYFNLIINHEKIISKLIDSINKAKAQHRSDQSPQIIIIDNEFAEDFRTPMLNGNVLYEEKLQEYVNRHTSNAIIILLYRNFTQNIPDIKFSIICKAEQAQIRKILEKLDFSPIDLNKFSLRST
jgi:hypothetical protein